MSSITQQDLSYKDLRKELDLDFFNCDLTSANLKEMDLSGKNLIGVNAYRANFHRTSLRKAKIRSAYFGQACLDRTDLTGADAEKSGCSFDRASLWQADLTKAQLRQSSGCFASFQSAILVETDFSLAKLVCADFTQATFELTYLRYACLKGACFWGCDLRTANFKEADLGGSVQPVLWDGGTIWPKDLLETALNIPPALRELLTAE
jgi:uncharacterized protein YjbI with pentapeptide repeats